MRPFAGRLYQELVEAIIRMTWRMTGKRWRGLAWWLPILIGGCVAVSPPPASDRPAVLTLVDGARADVAAGHYDKAAAAIERAIRIEPKNARLWHELARVRLAEGDPVQAESLSARALSWASGDPALRSEIWRLIAQARQQRGDDKGAREALERAEQ